MLYVFKIKVKDIETKKNNTSENGDNGTCWRQEDGTTEPIRKEVSREVKEKTQKKKKKVKNAGKAIKRRKTNMKKKEHLQFDGTVLLSLQWDERSRKSADWIDNKKRDDEIVEKN